jgi:hypothetical protein
MKRLPSLLMLTAAAAAAVLGGRAITAQDAGPGKYAVSVPDGLSFAAFRGYEGWQVVSASQSGELLKVTLANPPMIDAYRRGVPGNGEPVPDGAKMAKIMWSPKTLAAPGGATVPDVLKHVDFMVKDSKRFAGIGGWGYAQFNYDPASDRFTPEGTGADCGTACHTVAKARDYVFTEYGKR